MLALDDSWTMFRLGAHRFGLHTSYVREVVALDESHVVPRSQPFVRGVMDLRGVSLTLYDLRKRFALPPAEGEREIVLVAELGVRTLGLVTDEVFAIQRIVRDEIAPAEQLGARFDGVVGFGKLPTGTVLLLDIQWVVGEQARRFVRVPAALAVSFTVTRAADAKLVGLAGQRATTTDVSAGGVGLVTDLPLETGDEVALTIAFHATQSPITLASRVTRVLKQEPRTLGLAFFGVSDMDRGRITSAIDRLQHDVATKNGP